MASTVFERYGGFSTVSKIVLSFYDRMLDSPLTSPYFQEIDMKRLIDHQTKFIATIMGGPASYTNEHLDHVHERLGISEEAFTEALLMLRETLEDYDMEEADIRIVEDEMRARKNYVVSKK